MSKAAISTTYQQIDSQLRQASLAKIGGFRPPEHKLTSWFGGPGVVRAGESRPQYRGRDMFSLLQVNIDELPFVPDALSGVAFLSVFFSPEYNLTDSVNGEGWVLREYEAGEQLVVLPDSDQPEMVKSFPMRWDLLNDDAPSWEDAWELCDLTPINDIEGASDRFFNDYNRYPSTKVGGFPYRIQHGSNLTDFVFQIGSEEKPRWMWADNGVGYFYKKPDGQWYFECQFY